MNGLDFTEENAGLQNNPGMDNQGKMNKT